MIIGKSTIKLEEKLLSKNYYKNESRRLSDMQEINIIRIDKVGLSDYNKDNKRMRKLIRFIGANNQEERDNLAKGRRKLMKMNQELEEISDITELKKENIQKIQTNSKSMNLL